MYTRRCRRMRGMGSSSVIYDGAKKARKDDDDDDDNDVFCQIFVHVDDFLCFRHNMSRMSEYFYILVLLEDCLEKEEELQYPVIVINSG
mmetsp:Transcript_11377/g.17304  ORF Transcript_11377/g.17304 Transcript_11377/m.17304 type:complete len:89 (-) Transcript_11377:225-491(-)